LRPPPRLPPFPSTTLFRSGRMAHRDLRADSRRHAAVHVHDDVVLKVRISADNDLVEIAAQHGSVPDARLVLDRHVSDEDRARCEDRKSTRLNSSHGSISYA